MATIVPAELLAITKRLLFENLKLSFSYSSSLSSGSSSGPSGSSSEGSGSSSGSPLLEGDLMRYEKGTLTKSWQLRTVRLYPNRLEFYSGPSKKGEVLLTDCEIRLLFRHQLPIPCPPFSPSLSSAAAHGRDVSVDSSSAEIDAGGEGGGGCYAFSIRNPLGSVGILLDAGSHEARVRWVLAIQVPISPYIHRVTCLIDMLPTLCG